MTLRSKLASFHARIHSHRHSHAHSHSHFHLPRHNSKSKSPARKSSKRDSTSSTHSVSPRSSSSSSSIPSPVLTLIIPTTNHDVKIEARVYHPHEFPADYGNTKESQRKAAIVAHPYASLGGCWDDPVVLAMVALLIGRGWVVATFNFCGAGNSKGKTSWTGGPEREEYVAIAAFVIKYVSCIDPHAFTISPHTSIEKHDHDIQTSKPSIKVLLAGYSYGSLIASRVPTASKILSSADPDILTYAMRTAYEWASTEKRRSFAMSRNPANPWTGITDDTIDEDAELDTKRIINHNVKEQLETSYLFISPLLPPISLFLNLPNPLTWFKPDTKQLSSGMEMAGAEAETLAVYGTNDNFMGVGKYRNWAKGRTEKQKDNFRAIEVEGAGHFWTQDEGWMDKLKEGVMTWIDGIEEK